MRIEITEVLRLEEHRELSLAELADLSCLSEAELQELRDNGVIVPVNPAASQQTFAAHCLIAARTAARLREDFELDAQGIALALALLDRIRALEADLRDLKARSSSP
jgi:chaperone modulatory protein CbpM